MDLILSTALTSITYTIYLFKKKNYEDIKKIKPFPTKTTFTSSSPNKETVEAAEAALEKEVTYYLEGLVSPIKPTEIISCANPKKKAVLLKNIIKRHSVRWSNFWKDWLPEDEIISISGQAMPFNVMKQGQAQVTVPRLSLQDVTSLEDLPVISDNFINQNRKSIVKDIMDYVSGERFNGIETIEQGYIIGQPITLIGKFKKPEVVSIVTPTEINTTDVTIPSTPNPIPTTSPSSSPSVATSPIETPSPSPSPIESDDILIQSTNLPVFITEFKNEDTYCVISSKTFKEIIEEEGKNVRKWKWIVIGCTSIIGGVIGFRIWRYYRKKRRAEAIAAARAEAALHPEEAERLRRLEQATINIDRPNSFSLYNSTMFDILRDVVNWLLMDDDDYDYNSLPPHTPITEYIPDPLPIPPAEDENTSPSEEQNQPQSQPHLRSASSSPPSNNNSASPENNTNASSTLSPNNKTTSTASPTPPSTDENACVVCLSEKREYAFLPCRHLCVCRHCVHYLEKCPLCRSPIQNYIKIFS